MWSLSAAAIVRSLRLTDNSMFGLVLPTLVGIVGGGERASPRQIAATAGRSVGYHCRSLPQGESCGCKKRKKKRRRCSVTKTTFTSAIIDFHVLIYIMTCIFVSQQSSGLSVLTSLMVSVDVKQY